MWGWVGDREGSFSWSWPSWVGIEGSEADSGEAAGEEGEEGGVEGFFCLISGRKEGQRGGIEVMDFLSRERICHNRSAIPAASFSSSPFSRPWTCCLNAAGQPSFFPVLRIRVVTCVSSSLEKASISTRKSVIRSNASDPRNGLG